MQSKDRHMLKTCALKNTLNQLYQSPDVNKTRQNLQLLLLKRFQLLRARDKTNQPLYRNLQLIHKIILQENLTAEKTYNTLDIRKPCIGMSITGNTTTRRAKITS